MDPFAALGVDPGVSERELAAAYRRQARRWHPDLRGGRGDRRMAELNAAYASARRLLQCTGASTASEPATTRRPSAGAWLPQDVRLRLGWELLAALAEGERVDLVAEAGGAGRGPVRLALTDRRLLWLLEDAVSARVDWIHFGLVSGIAWRRQRLRRRGFVLRIRTRTGRRMTFGDLSPEVVDRVAARIDARYSGVASSTSVPNGSRT